jgi:hypothetical protein
VTRRRTGAVARTALIVGLLTGAILVLGASPASAHGLGGLKPTDYQTRLTGITPEIPGIELEVVDLGTRLRLTNDTAHDVTVLGYDGEPYLRVGPAGVFENTRSPATYFNRSLNPGPAPKRADSSATPVWRKIGGGTTASWHDHRAHFMGTDDPPSVARDRSHRHVIDEFDIKMLTAGTTVTARGEIVWVPPPSPWPWVALAVVLAAIVVALSRTRVWRTVVVGVLLALVVTETLHVVGLWGASTAGAGTKVAESAYSIGGIVLALLALVWISRKGADAAVPLVLIAAIFLFVAGGLSDVTTLGNSQIPSTLPAGLARLLVTITLGLGTGLAAAAAWRLRPTSAPRSASRRAPGRDVPARVAG